jgi:hypothetical protein
MPQAGGRFTFAYVACAWCHTWPALPINICGLGGMKISGSPWLFRTSRYTSGCVQTADDAQGLHFQRKTRACACDAVN